MSQSPPASLDQLGISSELRERARMMWLMTALAGAWGWVVCSFVWKVPGQEEDAWFQGQLKQALVVGLMGWVGYVLCGLGWLVHAVLGGLGFLTIGKGEDYLVPVVGGLLGNTAPAGSTRPQGSVQAAARPAAQAPSRPAAPPTARATDPIEGVDLPTWAWAQAHIDLGHPLEDILGRVQIEPERWKRVTAQWLVRRATDSTGVVQAEYERYRPAQATPQVAQPVEQARGGGGAEPIPVERWVEVAVALEIAQLRGWDSGQLLANFGLAPSDWGAAHAWWSRAFPEKCREQAFSARYEQLQQYYRQYYQGR